MVLNLQSSSGAKIQTTFQACKVNRPLWSVSKICDGGYEVLFTSSGATIRKPGSRSNICSFEKKNGLYVGAMQLQKPEAAVFKRQGS